MNKITALEYRDDDLVVWFEDSPEPFSPREFVKGSPTRRRLDRILAAIESAESVYCPVCTGIGEHLPGCRYDKPD